ncbi:MAG: hypothetical protein J6X18_04745 [Bacteroidales bacterium]|nr:hypothetical protein [Bacteroidales bacterium]
MTKFEELCCLFAEKYGSNFEVTLPKTVCILKDDYPSTHCSGSNAYITKVRFHAGKIEYYVDWWKYGWNASPDATYAQKKKAVLSALHAH